MGASSIDISQYRSRIGTFSRKNLSCNIGKSSSAKLKTSTLMESLIILSYLLVLSNVTQKLLIMSGVELNPGPRSVEKANKITAKKGRESNQQISSAGDNLSRRQDAFPGAVITGINNSIPPTPKTQQPKIDATDRRQVEAQNEDRSHTTKEELDDIKRTHNKEKKKKEQNDQLYLLEKYPAEVNTASGYLPTSSTTNAGTKKADTYAWDPKYAMNTKTGTTSSSSLRKTDNGSGRSLKMPDMNKLSAKCKNMGLEDHFDSHSGNTNPTHRSKQTSVDQGEKAKKIDQEVIQEPGASNNGKGKSDNVSVPKNKKSDPGNVGPKLPQNADAVVVQQNIVESNNLWKEKALTLRRDNPELTAREIAERCGEPDNFKKVKSFLQKNARRDELCNISSKPTKVLGNMQSSGKTTCSANVKPAYKCVDIKGKGLGMVSTRDIKSGELIVEEEPVITLFQGEDPDVVQQQFHNLPVAKRNAVMELYDRWASYQTKEHKNPLTIFRTNCVSRGAYSEDAVLCLKYSRFNHSCKPNVSPAFVDPNERVYAVRDIKAGEELCTYYVDPLQSKEYRQFRLQRAYGFTCNCEVCTLPKKESELSEKRREKYRRLDEKVVSVGGKNPREGLTMVAEIFEVLRQEEMLSPALIERHSYDGFQFAASISNAALAKRWATRAYEASKVVNGEEFEQTKCYERFMKKPQLHRNWGNGFCKFMKF